VCEALLDMTVTTVNDVMCLALIFAFIGFGQMTQWALGKHKAYRAEFKDYPRGRKAIIPFII